MRVCGEVSEGRVGVVVDAGEGRGVGEFGGWLKVVEVDRKAKENLCLPTLLPNLQPCSRLKSFSS